MCQTQRGKIILATGAHVGPMPMLTDYIYVVVLSAVCMNTDYVLY